MHKLLVLLSVFVILGQTAGAQDEPKITYGGMQQLGVAIEANAVNAMPNFINGIRYDRWFAGIGIAYEIKSNNGWSWGVSTMPIYFDARHYFFKKKWFFALADVGANVLVGNEWMTIISENGNKEYDKFVGYYGNIGCGVKSKLGNATYYSFDVSYNFKQTKYDRVWEDWQGRPLQESNNFKQRRILVRLGIEIN